MFGLVTLEGIASDDQDQKYRRRNRRGQTGEPRLRHAAFAGSVGMLGKCQTGGWQLRSEAWDGGPAEEYKTEHYQLVGGS